MTGDRALEEHEIRRALRLDAEEMPPRLDPALIAAAARLSRARIATGTALAVGVGFLGGWIWSEILRVAGSVLASTFDPLGALISAVSATLVALAPIAQAASAPAVPISILVVTVIAALFERMKGKTHATPS